MLTPLECRELSSKYKSLAQQPAVPRERAAMLKNIARSLTGLANQLDRLAADMRENGSKAASAGAAPADRRR